jgi:hypothetical protein
MMAAVQLWCRVTIVDLGGAEVVCCTVEGPGPPDLATVDDVAFLALLARRLGGGIVLADVSPALRSLLELTGLDLAVEMERQAELWEEPLGIEEGQEEVHGRDLPA